MEPLLDSVRPKILGTQDLADLRAADSPACILLQSIGERLMSPEFATWYIAVLGLVASEFHHFTANAHGYHAGPTTSGPIFQGVDAPVLGEPISPLSDRIFTTVHLSSDLGSRDPRRGKENHTSTKYKPMLGLGTAGQLLQLPAHRRCHADSLCLRTRHALTDRPGSIEL